MENESLSPPRRHFQVESVNGEDRLTLIRGSLTFIHKYRGPKLASLLERTIEEAGRMSESELDNALIHSPRWKIFQGGKEWPSEEEEEEIESWHDPIGDME
jgi:hypothetical protein